jgi:hypothetical protein
MSGEPDSAGGVPARQLKGLQLVAMSLVGGLITMTVILVAVFQVGLNGAALMGDGELSTMLGYGLLVLVPLSVFVVFALIPSLGKGQEGGASFEAYAGQFFMRAGLLEGPAIMLLIFFLVTGCWALLGGVAVLLAALIYLFPTAEKYWAWAGDRGVTEV